MGQRIVSNWISALVLSLATLSALAAIVVPRFPEPRPPDPAVIATLRVLAQAQQLLRAPELDRPAGATTTLVPEQSTHCFRLQTTTNGLRVHAWPLVRDPRAPWLFLLDEEGSLWLARDPAGACVGLGKPPPLDAGVEPLATEAPAATVELGSRIRRDRRGKIWRREE